MDDDDVPMIAPNTIPDDKQQSWDGVKGRYVLLPKRKDHIL